MKKLLILSLISISTSINTTAQINSNYEYLSMNPAVGIGIGSSNYFGDLNLSEDISAANSSTFGAHVFYHHPISKSFLGVVNLGYNKLSHWGIDSSLVKNFKTNIYGLDLGARYRFDNDIIFDQQKSFTFFVGLGVGGSKFSVKEDILSANNETYYYWNNGSIMNLPENASNASEAVAIERDYNYETVHDLTKSIFPYVYGEIGFGLKITHNLTTNFSYKYNFSFTDDLDNVTSNEKKDKYDYWNVSVSWNFGKPYRTADEIFRDKAAETIDLDDLDEDGVADINDLCAKTPLDWEVDAKGCPLDTDKDGVADAIDKELDSKKNAIVNEDGVTLTDEEIEVTYLLQTGQMAGHEKYAEWKEKYPKLFGKYYTKTTVEKVQSIEE